MSIQTEKDIISQDWEILEDGKIIQLNYQKWTDPPFDNWNQNCDCVTWTYDPDSSCTDGYKLTTIQKETSSNSFGTNKQNFEQFTKYKKRVRGNSKDCPIINNYFPCNIDCKLSDWKQPDENVNCYLEQDGYKYKRPIRQIISQAQGSGVPCPDLSGLLGTKIKCAGGPYGVSPYTDPCSTPLFQVQNPELCQTLVGNTINCNTSEVLLVNYRDTYCKDQFKTKCEENKTFVCNYLNTCASTLGITRTDLQKMHNVTCINGVAQNTYVPPLNIRFKNKLSFEDMFIRDNRGNYKKL